MACTGTPGERPSDTGSTVSDTDVDADSDADSDADADTDVDTDADADTDTGASFPHDLSALACSSGVDGCAAAGPFIPGTCCALGPGLVEVGFAPTQEAVDIELDDDFAFVCGGFGAVVVDRRSAPSLSYAGSMDARCQRTAVGPELPDGTRVLWLAHHGDSWADTPFLSTWHVHPDGSQTPVHRIEDPAVLFEGARWADDRLYVAAHAGGLRIYDTDAEGVPTLRTLLGGFDNALKLDLEADHAFVTDGHRLRVVRISDPDNPAVVATTSLAGAARDVVVAGGLAYVALGRDGFQVLDVSTPTAPMPLHHVLTEGSVQAIDVHGSVVALAAWEHVEVRDAATLELLATRTQRERHLFEQNLGVAVDGADVYASEWSGLHLLEHRQGMVAPDLWTSTQMLDFFGDSPWSQTVRLGNRGAIDLQIGPIAITDPASYSVTPAQLVVPPGQTGTFAVHYTPPGVPEATLTLHTNDPDPFQGTIEVPVYAPGAGTGLHVGDRVSDGFAFLDPTCRPAAAVAGTCVPDLANLEGKVTVVAYFALF